MLLNDSLFLLINTQQEASNTNKKKQYGAATDLGLTTGGNTSVAENVSATENKTATAAENSATGKSENKTDNATENIAENKTDNITTAETDQTSKASATGPQIGAGNTAGSGIKEVHAFILIIMIAFAVLFFLEKSQGYTLYSDVLKGINDNKVLCLTCVSIIMMYLYKL